jgi:hypothetical protein
MKRIKVLVLCLIIGSALSSCATPLASNLHAEKKTLKIKITLVLDPVEHGNSRVIYVPKPGHRFIAASLVIQNKTNQDLPVKLDKFELAFKKEVVMPPSIIEGNTLFGSVVANSRPVLSANESITRYFIYSFPLDYTPDRMVIPEIGEVVFPKTSGK